MSCCSGSMGNNNVNSIYEMAINDNPYATRSNGQNDTAGPIISTVNITPVQPNINDEVIVICTVTDDSEIVYVKIYYCTASFCTFQMPMDNIGEDKYKHINAPNSLPSGNVECHIIAKDAFNNTTEYNGTFEISGTSDNSKNGGDNGNGDDGFIPGFEIVWVIVGVFVVSIMLYYKKK